MRLTSTYLIYGLVLAAGGILALVPMPYKLLGLAMLIVAFGLPFYTLFVAKYPNNSKDSNRLEDLLMPAMASSAHIMTGGTMDSYYLDIDTLLASHDKSQKIITQLVRLIQDLAKRIRVDQLVFIERDAGPVGAIGLLGALTAKTGYDALIVRTKRLVQNSMIKPYDAISSESGVLLVTDVVTGGGHLRNAVQALQGRLEQKEFHVVCYACREETTRESLEKQGIFIHALYSPAEVQRGAKQYKSKAHAI